VVEDVDLARDLLVGDVLRRLVPDDVDDHRDGHHRLQLRWAVHTHVERLVLDGFAGEGVRRVAVEQPPVYLHRPAPVASWRHVCHARHSRLP
jgi:hypothetical protein